MTHPSDPSTPAHPTRTATRSRRLELMAIAADLFAERGFANVTVDHIGEAAGVSGPALYHHFRGKEALLGEMLVSISQHLLDGGTRIARHHPVDALAQLIAFHCEFAVDDRSLITVHFRDLIHATATDQGRVRRLQARYVSIWVDAVLERSPGVDRRTTIAAVHATFGLINSTPFSTRLPRAQMIDLLSSMATAALGQIDRGQIDRGPSVNPAG
jgi:AcrR family transcriptional regulator